MYDVNGRPTSKTLPIYAMSLVAFLKTYLSPGNIMISADKALYPSPSATQSQSDSVKALSSSFILVMERAGLRVISLTPPLKKSPSFNHRTCIGIEISVVGSRPPHASLALPISRSRLRGVFKLKLKGWLRCFEPRNCRVLSGRRAESKRQTRFTAIGYLVFFHRQTISLRIACLLPRKLPVRRGDQSRDLSQRFWKDI